MGNTIFLVVVLHFASSIYFLAYVAVYWNISKDYIFANGWTLEECTPVGGLVIPLYFIPVVNVVITYIALKLTEELTLQENIGQIINVYLWKLGIHYQETY